MTIVFSPELTKIQNYIRERAGAPLLPDPETQLHCSDCDQWKDDDQFYAKSGERAKNRRGRREHCKKCDNIRRRKWSYTNIKRERQTWRRRKAERKMKSGVELPFICECGLGFATKAGLGNHRRVCDEGT